MTSEHFLIIALMKQTKMVDKNPIEFQSRWLNEMKFEIIKQDLRGIDWDANLNSDDCNINFNIFCDILHNTMDKTAPLVQIKISGKRRIIEPWMTTGIVTST